MAMDTSVLAKRVVSVLDRLRELRGRPVAPRLDNSGAIGRASSHDTFDLRRGMVPFSPRKHASDTLPSTVRISNTRYF